MIRLFDPCDEREVADLHALQPASYSVEAALIGSADIPALYVSVQDLPRCGENFYGSFSDGRLVGAVSRKVDDGVLDLHRLVVHPRHFRKGTARALLEHVERTDPGVRRIAVSTSRKNLPALYLYQRMKHREEVREELAPGLRVTFLEREARGRARPLPSP